MLIGVIQLEAFSDGALTKIAVQALYLAVTAQAAFSNAPLAAPMPAPDTQASSEGATASPAATSASPAAPTVPTSPDVTGVATSCCCNCC